MIAVRRQEDDRDGAAAYPDRVQAFYGWLRGHPVLVDGVLALFLAALGLATLGIHYLSPVTTALFVVAMALPTALRRKYPLGAFAAVLVVGGIQVFAL